MVMAGYNPWVCRATLRVNTEEEKKVNEVTIAAINLSQDTGKDLETWITAPPSRRFEVLSHEFMSDAMYSWILFDDRDGIVYAVQSIDLEFEI
jgi:hypothetical protein